MKERILLTNSEGLKVLLDTERISAVGIDPASKERVFVICADKEYNSTRNPRGQFKRICRAFNVKDGKRTGFVRHG